MKSKVTVLGSGVAFSSFYKKFDYRNPSGHLLQYENLKILLDCGDGIRARLEAVKTDYYDLDAIFVSHFHPDHFALENLIQVFYVRATKDKKLKKLTVFGPENIGKLVIDIYNKKNNPNSWRENFPGFLEVTFHNFQSEQKIKFKKLEVTPFKVDHGPMDAYALRFNIGNKIFTYSGDSTYCEGLIKSAKNADLFICEAGANIIDDVKSNKTHLSPKRAGLVAKRADAAKLVLVHYTGKDTKKEMIEAVKSSGFRGTVFISNDLDSYSFDN